MGYAILTARQSDGPHWDKCVKENRVFVWVKRYRVYADVRYDTYSRKPGDRDRLTEEGIERLCETFAAHGCRAFSCGDTSGGTQKRIPLPVAHGLAQALCDLFAGDDLFTSDAAMSRSEKKIGVAK